MPAPWEEGARNWGNEGGMGDGALWEGDFSFFISLGARMTLCLCRARGATGGNPAGMPPPPLVHGVSGKEGVCAVLLTHFDSVP